jgi:hypothetical protein
MMHHGSLCLVRDDVHCARESGSTTCRLMPVIKRLIASFWAADVTLRAVRRVYIARDLAIDENNLSLSDDPANRNLALIETVT